MQKHPSLNNILQRWDKSRVELDKLLQKEKPQVQDSFTQLDKELSSHLHPSPLSPRLCLQRIADFFRSKVFSVKV